MRLCKYVCLFFMILGLLGVLPLAHAASLSMPAYETVKVAFHELEIVTYVFKPKGVGPFPVLLYSHGRSGSAKSRAAETVPIHAEHVMFWLQHGFAVVAPVRPGYGATGGADQEASGASWRNGKCVTTPDFPKVAHAAADAVVAVLNWTREQSWADTSRVLLEGQSLGGLATIEVGGMSLPGVRGYINFAGGTGANAELAPKDSCRPDLLTEYYLAVGGRTRVPSIWLYAANDEHWGPIQPKLWHAAFAKGGSATQLVFTEPVPGQNGHFLFRYGVSMWIADVERFLLGLRLQAEPV